MNVLISVNEKYAERAETMLFSLRCSMPDTPIEVYLICSQNNETITGRLEKYLRKYNINLHVIEAGNTFIDQLPIISYFSKEIYYRLIAQFLLPEELDRILWLDADIIVQKDLTKYYNQNLENCFMVVSKDRIFGSRLGFSLKQQLGIPHSHVYFNSGVLLLNLKRLRAETDLQTIVATAEELSEKLVFPDQDILNKLYQYNIRYCDWRVYNYQVGGEKSYR